MSGPDDDTTPYRFEPTTTAAALHDEYGGLDDGAETGVEVTIAGRLMLRRDPGRLAFGVLQDSTGRLQLFAAEATTATFIERRLDGAWPSRRAAASNSRARSTRLIGAATTSATAIAHQRRSPSSSSDDRHAKTVKTMTNTAAVVSRPRSTV